MREKVAPAVVSFFRSHIVPPEAVPNPETGAPSIVPARYSFSGVHAEEQERIFRAASAASGIVPTPEELTEAATAAAG